jgi:Uma2 family endonuclease
MALPAIKERVTIEEYLRREEAAVDRHEYHDGEILMMSGGTYGHSRINANLIRSAGNRLEGSPCFILESNMRLVIASRRRYLYPDATIACGQPQFDPHDPKKTTIINPRVVIEVLSPSTEAYDRGDKFNAYRELESLGEYVLVSQERPLIETFVRQADGTWVFAAREGVKAISRIATPGIELPLGEVYAGITFEADGEERVD